MARNDYILDKPDSKDVKEFDLLIRKALLAKRKIEDGFLELAESIYDIHKKKLYRLKYKTFSEFCEEELGFSRQTVYVYLSILKLIGSYPEFFSKDRAIEFGHKKMRYITEGINIIDRKIEDEKIRESIKLEILQKVAPEMASTEIEAFIEDKIQEL